MNKPNSLVITPIEHIKSISVKILCLICSFLFVASSVHASIISHTFQFKKPSAANNEVSLFSWLFGSETQVQLFL